MSILELPIVNFNDEDKPRNNWISIGYTTYDDSGTTILTISGETFMSYFSTNLIGDIGSSGDNGVSGTLS